MEGAITIPAAAIWAAAGSFVTTAGLAARWVAGQIKLKDDTIAALQAEIKQKLQDDIDFYRRIERERSDG